MKRFFINFIVYATVALVASCGIIIPLKLFDYNQSRMTNRIDAKTPKTVVEPINISNINSSDTTEEAEGTQLMSFKMLTYKVCLLNSGMFSTTEYSGSPKDILPQVYETIDRLSKYLPIDAQMWENAILAKFNLLELSDPYSKHSNMFIYEITFMRFTENKTASMLTMVIDAEDYMVYDLFLDDASSESANLPLNYYKDILSSYKLSAEEKLDFYSSEFPSYDEIQVSASCSIGHLIMTYSQTKSNLSLRLSCDIPDFILKECADVSTWNCTVTPSPTHADDKSKNS